MKKFLLGTVALAALAVPATAADLGVRPVAYARAFSWSGCHLGGDVGWQWGQSQGFGPTGASTFGNLLPGVPVDTTTNSFNMSGAIGGGYFGCDYQVGAWVFGVEGDWSVVNKEGQAFGTGLFNNLIFGQGYELHANERWLATARGRLGYAVDNWLVYATGGAAWMKVDTSENCGFLTPSVVCATAAELAVIGSSSLSTQRVTGYTVGAGWEYAPPQLQMHSLPGRWTVRAEYLYVRIRDFTTFSPGTQGNGFPGLTVAPTNLNVGRISDNIVRFGLAYSFGGYAYAPAVVK
jgi:outer membrane immunogenic protein